MDPATLYIVFMLPNGAFRPMERAFVDPASCEAYVANQIRPKTQVSTIVRYECVALAKMQDAPSWYRQHTPTQKLINGVPLDKRYMP